MKKAFTLVELLIVMIIIWVLLYAVRWIFTYKNVEQVKFDTCYIHTYGKVTNFMQEALLQKMYFHSWEYKKIGLYTMHFDVTNQKLKLTYSWSTDKYTSEIIYSWNWIDKINDCYTETYVTKLTWSNLEFKINPWLQKNYIWDESVKMFSWGTQTSLALSWNIIFSYCEDKAWKHCKQKYKLSILPSVYVVKSYFCKKIDWNWKCVKWTK